MRLFICVLSLSFSLSQLLCFCLMPCLDQIGHVHGHLLDLGAVKLLNLTHHAHILGSNEVDGNTLTAETTTATNTVDIVLTVGRQVIVDDQRHLLDIDTTGEQVGSDEHTRRAGTELLHDQVTLGLIHVTVHSRDGEVALGQLLSEPVNLATGVAENDGLGNGDRLVQIGESVQLPLLLLDSNVKLLNTLQGKLVLLDQNADGVAHELGRDLEDILRHGGREQDDLGGLRQQLEDVVDLLGETTLQRVLEYHATVAHFWACEPQLTESISSASSRTNIFMASVLRKRR